MESWGKLVLLIGLIMVLMMGGFTLSKTATAQKELALPTTYQGFNSTANRLATDFSSPSFIGRAKVDFIVHFDGSDNTGWDEIGGSGSAGGISNNSGESSWPSVAIGTDGELIIAWEDHSSGKPNIYVRRWDGSAWAEIGNGSASGDGISNNNYYNAYGPSLDIGSDGVPVVAWTDGDYARLRIYVLRWNGSAWVEVGSGSASGDGISDGPGRCCSGPSLAIGPDNVPVVAWFDDRNGNSEIFIRKWDGLEWVEIGSGSASTYGISRNTSHSIHPSLAITPEGVSIVAWEDGPLNNREIFVRGWDGSVWAEMGTHSASGGGISNNTGQSKEPSLAIGSDGVPVIAWMDNSGGNEEIYVRRWNGSAWTEIGDHSATGGGISNTPGYSSVPSLAIGSNANPVVSWVETGIFVRRWNGSAWVEFDSGSASSGGISNTGSGGRPSLSISPDGASTVAWMDRSVGNSEIYVRQHPGAVNSYTISGRVSLQGVGPLSGVSVSTPSGSVTTDSNGEYTITDLPRGTYTVTPSRAGYTFMPASRSVTVPPNISKIDFIAISPPTITGFSPTSGAIGTVVNIHGSSFVGATSVSFNEKTASFKVVSNTQMEVIVPSGAVSGKIAVTTPSGTATSSGNFTVINPLLELAKDYAPIVRMHPYDKMVPMNVELALDHARCITIQTRLENECQKYPPIGLETISENSWLNQPKAYIDFMGSPGLTGNSQQYFEVNILKDAQDSPTAYAYVYEKDGHYVIQYWLFYYYNNWYNKHEGDWEMIQVVLDESSEPEYVAITQHKTGTRREWDSVSKIDKHPIVYPAKGSHANYFFPAKYFQIIAVDTTSSESNYEQYLFPNPVLVTNPTPSWLFFKGRWGEKKFIESASSGPGSPGVQDKWENPIAWSGGLIYDEEAPHNGTKVRVVVGLNCAIAIEDTVTGKWWGHHKGHDYDQIDSVDPIRNVRAETTTIILHESYDHPRGRYTVYWSGDPCEPRNTQSKPNPEGNQESILGAIKYLDDTTSEIVTLTYDIPADWISNTSTAYVSLAETETQELQIDIDGDSVFETTQPPRSIDREPLIPVPIVDFYADSQTGSNPLTVNFFDISSGWPDTWLWDFGDGQTSSEANPTHTYESIGTYTVSLRAGNSTGTSSKIKVAYITITAPPPSNIFLPFISDLWSE